MSQSPSPLPLICVAQKGLDEIELSAPHRAWADANAFSGTLGEVLSLPGGSGEVAGVLFGIGEADTRPALALGLAGARLKAGQAYSLSGSTDDATKAALGFALGAYRFDRYRKPAAPATLVEPEGADMDEATRLRDAAFLARDLINTPANDLGPDAFEDAIRKFAYEHEASVRSVVGDALLAENFPMIHAVGRAAAEAPRLLDLSWGRADAPKVTLVGKGVTFDTGGLDIKPAAGMLLMKKDMGGAANILGLAHAIMDAQLDVRLRVLLPIVENAISAASFRPGDVLPSRNGMTVEIGNTDAEGRLILADALTLADEDAPEVIVDMATLTGAARVALGPDLPPMYSTDDALGTAIQSAGMAWDDPVWPMPLWQPYDKLLASKIADVSHISSGPFAGSITAALFLKRFVKSAGSWVHLDIFGWAPEPRAARPFGGTDQAQRAVYFALKAKYG